MKRTALTIAVLITVLTSAHPQNTPAPAEETLAQINEKNRAIASSPQNAELYYERGRLYGCSSQEAKTATGYIFKLKTDIST